MKFMTLILFALASATATAAPCEVGGYVMADGTSLDIAAGERRSAPWRRDVEPAKRVRPINIGNLLAGCKFCRDPMFLMFSGGDVRYKGRSLASDSRRRTCESATWTDALF